MKRISSKRAKACSISPKVKAVVWERDMHRCVYCKSINAFPEAHYIPRCRLCHDAFDNGTATMRQEIGHYCRDYLKALYPGWDEKNLIYRKDDPRWQ